MLKSSTYMWIYPDIWYSYIWISDIQIFGHIWYSYIWISCWCGFKIQSGTCDWQLEEGAKYAKSIQIFGNPNGLIFSQLVNPSSENILVLLMIMWSWSKSTNILTGKCCLSTLIHSVQSQLYWTAVERSFSCLQVAMINQHWNLLSLHLATILNPFEPWIDLHSLMEKWQTKERESWFLTKFQCIEFDVKVSS